MNRVLIVSLSLLTLACSGTHSSDRVPSGVGPVIVVYKAAIDDGNGPVRGAKLSVWAERPDRLHAELIAPFSGVTFIVDAGGGNTCIVDVALATAYVGDDGPGAIEALTGVRISVADAVAALLDGTAPTGLTVTRTGGIEGSLPETLRIADGERSLVLDRVRFARGTADPRTLGTGLPPGNLAVLPLDRLAPDAVR